MRAGYSIFAISALTIIPLFSRGQLELKQTIEGRITPKSVVHNGNGLFFAQNMIYSHTITVYNTDYELVRTISDRVRLEDYDQVGGSVKGGPVEAAFSHNGRYAWVSNYTMEGKAFNKPGCDNCSGDSYDPGFLYKISTDNLKLQNVIKVGAVPKFVAVSPNDKFVLVSNWTSGDVSVISTENDSVIKTVQIGRHPRGIVVDPESRYAYITVMGSDKIARLDLKTFGTSYLPPVGKAPRHVCIDKNGRYLYCSINNLGKIVKIDLLSDIVVAEVITGRAPRSMEISPDGKYLYVVNYSSNSFSKVKTSSMSELEEVSTKSNPIGLTLNWDKREIWVACYSGYIQVFHDASIPVEEHSGEPDILAMSDDNFDVLQRTLTSVEPAVNTTVIPENVETIEETEGEETVENNYLPGTYIVVGSFKVESNALKLANNLSSKGYETKTLPSMKAGFTYTAILVKSNPTRELVEAKEKIISSAWIYRP